VWGAVEVDASVEVVLAVEVDSGAFDVGAVVDSFVKWAVEEASVVEPVPVWVEPDVPPLAVDPVDSPVVVAPDTVEPGACDEHGGGGEGG